MVGFNDIDDRVDRKALARALDDEKASFLARTQKSQQLYRQGTEVLLGGVPMSWMNKWVGGYPIYFASASGSSIADVDGNSYIDFCLGDTGAMAGHSPPAVARAVMERVSGAGGITTMLPNSDAAWVGKNLKSRFSMDYWQFTLSATDANRFALRLARQITSRPKILVFSYCYHGSVDETFVTLENGVARSRAGNVGPAVDPTRTTEVVEFNDIDAVRAVLASGEIAAVLTEPALTNIGIVLPLPGFLSELKRAAHQNGTLLILDETHTFSAGYGGAGSLYGITGDMMTIGKSLGGGVPFGAYGMTQEVADRVGEQSEADYVDTGGIGGTLAGNALSLGAARASLEEIFTRENFALMIELASHFSAGVTQALERFALPWSVVSLGARVEYRFCGTPPISGGESARAADEDLDTYFHLFMLNRSILMTPFHNMALMSPSTTLGQVQTHTEVFEQACRTIAASPR